MEIGISTGIIYNYNLLEKIFLFKEAGFDSIEICFNPRLNKDKFYQFNYQNWLYVYELKDKLKELGLKIHSIHAPYSSTFDISGLNEQQRVNTVNEIRNIIDVLRVLDGSVLVLHPTIKEMSENNFKERSEWFKKATESLRDIIVYGEKKGIKIAVENLLPHIFFGGFNDLLNLVNQFDSKNSGICLDTSHANLGEGALEAVKKFGKKINSLHISDNYGKNDDHFPVGEGIINWDEFLGELWKANFKGVFMLEILKEVKEEELPSMLKKIYKNTRRLVGGVL